MDFRAFSFEELCEKLSENKKTLIVFHTRPDADAIGSAFALRELFSLMGIQAICACDDEVPARLSFLTEEVQGGVVLDDFFLLGHERVISVDSASPQQIGSLFERLHRNIDIMIDHHAKGKVYAEHYIRSDAAATGEIIFDIAEYLRASGKIDHINRDVYGCIYAAISSDTGCFKYSNVTPKTHEYAAKLIEFGVDTADINQRLYASKSFKQVKAEGEAARRLVLFDGGRIGLVKIPYAVKFSMGLDDEHLETVIDIPRSVAGVEVAVAVKQLEDNCEFRVSMRSNGEFDVSEVCSRFGGGGHKRAAGCTIAARDIDEVERILVREIRARL
jgi:phosphoesterase RecJ-like protein